LDGDPTVCDLGRVLRLAGFPHQKDPARPFLVKIRPVPGAPASPYSDQEFQNALAAAESAQLAAPKERNLTDTLTSSLGEGPPDLNQGYPDGQRTRELTRRAGYCHGPKNMTEEQTVQACLEWNHHNTPPLSDEKVRSTVASIAKSEARQRQANSTADHSSEQTDDRGTAEHAAMGNQSASARCNGAEAASNPDDRATLSELARLSLDYARR
jgi:hypothetical protein